VFDCLLFCCKKQKHRLNLIYWKFPGLWLIGGQKMTVFWDVAPCSFVEIDRRFRGAYCLQHQGSKHIWNVWNVSQFLRDYTAQHPRRLIFILAAVRTWNLNRWTAFYSYLPRICLYYHHSYRKRRYTKWDFRFLRRRV
jgi:hypothetical protein